MPDDAELRRKRNLALLEKTLEEEREAQEEWGFMQIFRLSWVCFSGDLFALLQDLLDSCRDCV